MILSLGALSDFVVPLLVVLFLFISVVMVLVVLVQRPQGGGLSGAFGGASAGSSQTAFGARTGDALTIITIGIFVAFLALAIGLNYLVGPPSAVPADTAGAAPPGTTQQDGALPTPQGTGPSPENATTTIPPVEEIPAEPPTEGETGEATPERPPAETGEGEGGNSEETSEPPSEGGEGSGGGA